MNEIFLDDLRDKVHRGLSGQAMKYYWCGGRPYGYRLKPITDACQRDAYGQAARIGTVLEIDAEQAAVVRQIFEGYASGLSCMTIARDLNERGVPSPGSTWKRKTRRCSGWMNSAVRGILKNPLCTGLQRWNVSQYLRDPDSGKDRWRARPKSEANVSSFGAAALWRLWCPLRDGRQSSLYLRQLSKQGVLERRSHRPQGDRVGHHRSATWAESAVTRCRIYRGNCPLPCSRP